MKPFSILMLLVLLGAAVHVVSAAETYAFTAKWGTLGFADGQFNTPFGVAVDSAGNVYVADLNNNRVQKFDARGNIITKWGRLGAGDGLFQYPRGIAIDTSDNVFVIDATGLVQKFTVSGTFISKWTTGDGSLSKPPNGIAVDRNGYVYVADTYNNRILKYSSTGSLVTSWGTEGTADGQMYRPDGVAVDSAGDVFVLDTYNYRIQKFTATGTFVSKWDTNGVGDNYQFLSGIAVDGTGNVFVSGDSDQVLVFTSTGTFMTRWGTRGTGDGQFDYPRGVAVSRTGAVYVADTYNHRVQAFSMQGAAPIPTMAEVYRVDKIWGTQGTGDGQFNNPCGVAVDHGGNVYIPDIGNHRVQKFTSNGSYITQFGSIQVNWSEQNWSPRAIAIDNADTVYIANESRAHLVTFDDQLKAEAKRLLANFTAMVRGMAVDNSSNLYYTDASSNTAHKLDPNRNYSELIGFLMGGAELGQFSNPGGIAVDGTGSVYVADTGNDRVQKFGPNGSSISLFGIAGFPAFGPFTRPAGVAVDHANNVYVTDTGNNRVLKYDANGTPLAQIGGSEGAGSTRGAGVGQFNSPMGVAIDLAGNVYVADSGNNRIQKFVRQGAAPTPTVSPVTLVPGGVGIPRNLDGDAKYEDVNGNERKDFADVVLYFNQMAWIAANEPVELFDYNENGRIDFADVVWLFNKL